MAAIPDKIRFIAMAMIKLENSPRDIADKLNISYATVIKYSKELIEAERRNAVLELFNMDAVAFAKLLELVRTETQELMDVITIDGEAAITNSVETIASGVSSLQMLEVDLSTAASALANKIKLLTQITTTPDELVMLCDALSKLQMSFFAKGTTVQVANFMGKGDQNGFLND